MIVFLLFYPKITSFSIEIYYFFAKVDHKILNTKRTPLFWTAFSLTIEHSVNTSPSFSISTKTVYEKIDSCTDFARPDTNAIIRGLHDGDLGTIASGMGNVLEEVSLSEHPILEKVKEELGVEIKFVSTITFPFLTKYLPTFKSLISPAILLSFRIYCKQEWINTFHINIIL